MLVKKFRIKILRFNTIFMKRGLNYKIWIEWLKWVVHVGCCAEGCYGVSPY